MTSVRIDIPIPPRSLSPNGRAHWHAKGRAKRSQRDTARLTALAELGRNPQPRWHDATVSVTWYAKSARWPDADNAIGSLKGAIDGLVDAGVLIDDDRLTWLPIERRKDAKRPRVEIEITKGATAA